jgi:hypothetical protein
MLPRYIVIKGLNGNGSGDNFFWELEAGLELDCGGRTVDLRPGAAFRGRSKSINAGVSNRAFRRTGDLEYTVTAKRVAAALMRKSASAAWVVYIVKACCRAWSADQSSTVDFDKFSKGQKYVRSSTYRQNKRDGVDFPYGTP